MKEVNIMRADVGDTLVIGGHAVGHAMRRGLVQEVRGEDGGPPYLVQWDDSDHATLFFPGSDCVVEHKTPPS
jgi:hypothetical protein